MRGCLRRSMPLAEPTDTARTLRFPAWATWLRLRCQPGAPGRRAPSGCPLTWEPCEAIDGKHRMRLAAPKGGLQSDHRIAARAGSRFSPSVRNAMAKNCAGHVSFSWRGPHRKEAECAADLLAVAPATRHSPFCRHKKNAGVLNRKGNMCYLIARHPGAAESMLSLAQLAP
jgi:hypothetical protein